jgi:hypothetical protein
MPSRSPPLRAQHELEASRNGRPSLTGTALWPGAGSIGRCITGRRCWFKETVIGSKTTIPIRAARESVRRVHVRSGYPPRSEHPLASVAGMSSPPLNQPGDPAGLWVQAAGSLNSGLALAPGPGPGPASSSEYGASSWRPGHPGVARGGPRQANRRWSRPQRWAHGAGTPGRPVCASQRHDRDCVQPHSAHWTACRAAWWYAPIALSLAQPPLVAPS